MEASLLDFAPKWWLGRRTPTTAAQALLRQVCGGRLAELQGESLVEAQLEE